MEIEQYALTYSHEPIETIYFGGGTPSLLHLDEIHRILDTIHEHYDTSALREVTLEMNPDDANLDYFSGLLALGIDRLSIGIQSFFAPDLQFMNRSHTVAQAEDVVPLARKAGFVNFSVDLIFGLPDQPKEYWAANLAKVINLDVPHLSTYSLTIEERTPLHKQVQNGLVLPTDDDTMAKRFQFTMDHLRKHGYEHYEISSFAKPGHRAIHNQHYWNHTNYLGFGPSAHSFWWKSLPSPVGVRWANVRNLKRYEALMRQRQTPIEFREQLAYDQMADEHIMLRLRTEEGLNLDELEDKYGADLLFDKIDELASLEALGYIEPIRNSRIRLTDQGKRLCDAVTEKLLLER
jgi:oxygen-independent coproporphyrinogen-3 oxidase